MRTRTRWRDETDDAAVRLTDPPLLSVPQHSILRSSSSTNSPASSTAPSPGSAPPPSPTPSAPARSHGGSSPSPVTTMSIPWLEPDWVLDMADANPGREAASATANPPRHPPRRSLGVGRSFSRHHYLSGNLHRACPMLRRLRRRPPGRVHRGASVPAPESPRLARTPHGLPARFPGRRHRQRHERIRRESVCRDRQSPISAPAAIPAVIHHRRSPLWKMLRRPGLVSRIGPTRHREDGNGRTRSAPPADGGV